MSQPGHDDLDRDKSALLSAMDAASNRALEYFRNRDTGLNAKRKSDGTMYSDVDIAVNDLLRERLQDHDPGYGWLSEEDDDDFARLEKSRVWIVDPIDGSRVFLEGGEEFTICVCLVEDGIPLLAAVSAPALGEHYHAICSRGAWCNDTPMSVREPMHSPELGSCRLLVSGRLKRKPLWRELFGLDQVNASPAEYDRPAPGSIAYRVILVACGVFDATVSVTEKCEWDLAAAHLIAAESGVSCSTCEGESLWYNRRNSSCAGILAAPAGLRERLAERVCAGLAQERVGR